jgi:MraZ protein
MATFIGEFICKLDNKGRILLPAALKRQMKDDIQDRFIIKKDIFEKCLILYPMQEWEKQNARIERTINPYNRDHNKFVRGFFKNTYEVILDANNRLLIPKRLLNEIGADRELMLAGQSVKIEIWPVDTYSKVESGDSNFAALAEKIMGTKNYEPDEHT